MPWYVMENTYCISHTFAFPYHIFVNLVMCAGKLPLDTPSLIAHWSRFFLWREEEERLEMRSFMACPVSGSRWIESEYVHLVTCTRNCSTESTASTNSNLFIGIIDMAEVLLCLTTDWSFFPLFNTTWSCLEDEWCRFSRIFIVPFHFSLPTQSWAKCCLVEWGAS